MPICRTCARENAKQRCSRCLTAHYCSAACQKADWKEHKKTCKKATIEDIMDYRLTRKNTGDMVLGGRRTACTPLGGHVGCALVKGTIKDGPMPDQIALAIKQIDMLYSETRRHRSLLIRVLPWGHREIVDDLASELTKKYKVIDLYENTSCISCKALYEADIALVDPYMIDGATRFGEIRRYVKIVDKTAELAEQFEEVYSQDPIPIPYITDCPEIPDRIFGPYCVFAE